MVERKSRTRKPTSAERLAARALGRPDPVEVEVETTSTADLHAARLTDPRESAKPRGVQTWEWYAQRARGEDGPPAA